MDSSTIHVGICSISGDSSFISSVAMQGVAVKVLFPCVTTSPLKYIISNEVVYRHARHRRFQQAHLPDSV